MYQIKVYYETGDSFGRQDEEQLIEHSWSNLDIVKENLDRIRQHYDMYEKCCRHHHASFKDMKKEYGHCPWFVDTTAVKGQSCAPEFMAGYALNLLKDDGTEFRYSVFWTGYFEHLYGADVVENLPSFRT